MQRETDACEFSYRLRRNSVLNHLTDSQTFFQWAFLILHILVGCVQLLGFSSVSKNDFCVSSLTAYSITVLKSKQLLCRWFVPVTSSIFQPADNTKKHIHKACRKNISAFYSLYSIIFYTFAVKILANDAETITSLPQRNKKQILLAKTITIWKMAKEKSKGIWSVMVL